MEHAYHKLDLEVKLKKAKAVFFDWDGVFNDGSKSPGQPSAFSERDSMGTNMLRYAMWLNHGQIPLSVVISGANNEVARYLAGREHFHYEISGALFKADAVKHILDRHQISAEEAIFFYDDILDLSVAEMVGIRCQVRYPSSPSINQYVDEHDLADCWVQAKSTTGQVRNLCDILLMHMEVDQQVIQGRSSFSKEYQTYFAQRQAIPTVHTSAADLLQSDDARYLAR